MDDIARIVQGILGIALGYVLTVKANWVVNNTGRIATAERYLGSAGTYTFVRIAGISLMIIFLAHMIGILGVMYLAIVGFLSSVFGG